MICIKNIAFFSLTALLPFLTFFILNQSPIQAEEKKQDSVQNVLFIAVDDLKPLLGCYGDMLVISPTIDALASEGTVFLNSHCQWPVCGPSRASLMTGLRPEATGVMDLKTDMRSKDPNILTLPQHFKNHGYITAGTGKIYDPRCVDNKTSLDTPSWSIPFMKTPLKNLKHKAEKNFVLAPDVDDDELYDGQIAKSGVKLIQRMSKQKKPFFLAVGFKKPHLPFIAPKKYWDLYDPDQINLATHRGGIENASGYSLHDSNEFRGYKGVPKDGPFTEELQREAIHGYYACVSYVDAQIKRLLDELKATGLDKNTLVVLWGDHGFHLGDHGIIGKHSTLENATRSPLIIKHPTIKTIQKTTSPVEFTDIFPTLCEFTQLPVPKTNGRSLVKLMTGDVKQIRNGAVTVFKSKGCRGYSYRTERYRYTEWINKKKEVAAVELYDYEKDPLEKINLASLPEHEDLLKRLAKQLREEGQGCEWLFGQ